MGNFKQKELTIVGLPTDYELKQEQVKMYSEEEVKQFGLYLGDNLKKLKDKTIDEIFEQYKYLQRNI